MKLAIIGIRGIPVIYSGFESFSENLALELIKRDCKVIVYCRSPYVNKKIKKYKGICLVTLPTLRKKNLESILHSFFSTVHACLFSKPEVVLYFGVGNAIFSIFPRLFGIKTIVNVDGLDWKREKWGKLAKIYLKISEYLAVIFPNATITDSKFIQEYYLNNHHKKTDYIPYGFNRDLLKVGRSNLTKLFDVYSLQKQKYFVWVGRLVPENHLEELIVAFNKLKTAYKCVIVGNDLYKSIYKENILNLGRKDKRIIFTGFLEREDYVEIVMNSYAYVETKRSGGTHPSLIEAMGMGSLILSNNYPANRDILNKSAVYYKINDAETQLLKLLKLTFSKKFQLEIQKYKNGVKNIVRDNFAMQKITSQYISLLSKITSN